MSKGMIRQLLSKIIVVTMIVVMLIGVAPKQVQASVNEKNVASTYLNSTTIYLYLGEKEVDTYDFNIRKEKQEKAVTYSWYVKEDKGNPDSVDIDKRTGIVTAKEAGTAYIRCKITSAKGTILRPEARVTVRNNITGVEINNLPEDLTMTVGTEINFNITILNTAAGKSATTQGITRWEIAENTAGVENVTVSGKVIPTKEGKFNIRAVCFQSTAKYKVWLADKAANDATITASSEWYTIKVSSANTVITGETAPIDNYTALGDSITYGMTATTGFDYVSLFYNNINATDGSEDMKLINIGIPGAKSSDLLNKLQKDATTRDAVSKAKVITVSIGGNNLLSPVISAFATAFKLDPKSETFANDVSVAFTDPNNKMKLFSTMAGIQSNLESGVQQFTADWVDIIATIKLLAPEAEIYVMTLYNPINQENPLYSAFDKMIQEINSVICTPNAGYKVADVYTAFHDYKGTKPLVNFDMATGNFDPHPTNEGHELIYECHLGAK